MPGPVAEKLSTLSLSDEVEDTVMTAEALMCGAMIVVDDLPIGWEPPANVSLCRSRSTIDALVHGPLSCG